MRAAGKYDDLCALVRAQAGAYAAIVIVINGRHGHGFSVQATREVLSHLPAVLRNVADQIEAQAKGQNGGEAESPTYSIALDGRSITCGLCGRTSFHPKDVEERYCANCHYFHAW